MPHTRPHVVCAIAITICPPSSISLSHSISLFLFLSCSLSHGCGLANILRSQCDIVVEMPIGRSKANTHCKGNQIAKAGKTIHREKSAEDFHVYLCGLFRDCLCVCVCVCLSWHSSGLRQVVLGFGIASMQKDLLRILENGDSQRNYVNEA